MSHAEGRGGLMAANQDFHLYTRGRCPFRHRCDYPGRVWQVRFFTELLILFFVDSLYRIEILNIVLVKFRDFEDILFLCLYLSLSLAVLLNEKCP